MQVKMNGRKGTLCDSTITLQLPQILPFCICFSFKFGFVLWEEDTLQGHRVDMREWVDEEDQDACCEIRKESIKVLLKK